MKMKFHVEKEMEEVPNILRKRSGISLKQFSSIVQEPVLLTGMGSSVNLPCFDIERITDFSGLNVKARYACEIGVMPQTKTVIALSNSGETRETVESLKDSSSKIRIAITRDENSSLAKHSTHFIKMLCGEEKAIPATKSVVEQTYIINQLFREKIGKYKAITNDEICEIENNLKSDFDNDIIEKFLNAGKIIVVGEKSLASEVQLKFEEIARILSRYEIGTMFLHGPITEILGRDDIILVVSPEMLIGYENLISKRVKSHFVGIEELGIRGKGNYKNIMRLCGLLRLMCEVGKRKNISIDKPETLSKVATTL